MHDLFHGVPCEWLPLDAYLADFTQHFWKIGPPGFWKLERQQTFKEPTEPSWLAFDGGRWGTALELIERNRDDFSAYYRRIENTGFINRRVRVIEFPISAYLQWELHVLLLRHQFGGLTNVVPAARVESLETCGQLPEVYTLGTRVMYEAVYDADGVLTGARRFTDRELMASVQRLIADLYRDGEPLDVFFAREVAPLKPPFATA